MKLVVEAALRENEEILDFKLLGFSSQGGLTASRLKLSYFSYLFHQFRAEFGESGAAKAADARLCVRRWGCAGRHRVGSDQDEEGGEGEMTFLAESRCGSMSRSTFTWL